MGEKRIRKVRSVRAVRKDKKRDLKPSISPNLKECIYRLSYITNTPVKDVAEAICESGINSRKVIEHLSNYFRRPFQLGSTVFMGNISRTPFHKTQLKGPKERITLRVKDGEGELYERIRQLSYALDCTPTMATAILLDVSVKNTEYVNEYVRKHIEGQLDPNRMKQLKEVIAYINKNNPYEEEVTLSALVFYLLDELKLGATSVKSTLEKWIDKVRN